MILEKKWPVLLSQNVGVTVVSYGSMGFQIVDTIDLVIFEHKIKNIFLPISLNICFGCSKGLSHWHVSLDNPQNVLVEK